MSDELKIGFRCESHWSEMEGNDKVCFCSLCKQDVHNVCNLSAGELKNLILAKRRGERVCVRKSPHWLTRVGYMVIAVALTIITFRFSRPSPEAGMMTGVVLNDQTFPDFGSPDDHTIKKN